jgi:hypothetical protein
MKGDVTGGTFSLNGREEKSIYVSVGKSEGKTRIGDLCVNGNI